jgi:hypothetical protein
MVKPGSPHAVAEEPILPAASRMLGDTAAENHNLISLSNTMVKW